MDRSYLGVTSAELDDKEVVIYGIVDSIPLKISGTALYSDNGMTRIKGKSIFPVILIKQNF